MSNGQNPDNNVPTVTFGSYIIPDTVREHEDRPEYPFIQGFHTEAPAQAVAGNDRFDTSFVTKALLVVLTFLLGALTTFLVAGGGQTDVAEVDAVPVEAAPETVVAGNVVDNLQQAVLASAQEDVTRTQAGDLTFVAGSMSRAEPSELTMSEILLGLKPKPTTGDLTDTEIAQRENQELVTRNNLELLREGVLAGRFTVKTIKRNGKERLCLRLPHAKISQNEAADMIERAAARGEIELPEALSTSDGSYDADTLIFNLVQTSLANDGTAEGAAAALEMSRRASEASSAKTKKVAGKRIYVVEPGDSLAYISLQFYGKPSDFNRIFEANSKVLSSPDRIQVGQRLIIPS